eukprot:TRINITY_DN16278_c0_g1_i1.p1 TRINITY_DN16278_c0_g1~~TRINITY_DN16278_c0_g1_i1.p1  ORF type:complete len:250 (+),score=43.00 TRINITY_DN16278_c0_g1_i1:12-761(+)
MNTPTLQHKRSDFEEAKLLIESRYVNWGYIKRVHEGITFWMNIIHITKNDLVEYYTRKIKSMDLQKRCKKWYCLGISLSNLLILNENLESYLKKLDQLFGEFENFSKLKKETSHEGRILQIPNMPGDFDYLQIVYSLMDVINLVYKKILEKPSEVNNAIYNLIKKIDQKFLVNILKIITKDLHKLQESLLKNMSKVDSLLQQITTPIDQGPIRTDAFVSLAKIKEKKTPVQKLQDSENMRRSIAKNDFN